MNLPQLAQDKANHALYGALIAALVLVAALAAGRPLLPACAVAAIVTAVAAILKEVIDRRSGKGTPEGRDALATIGGAVLSLAPSLWQALAPLAAGATS